MAETPQATPEMSYINKKGKKIIVTATEHAKRRFIQRWRIMHPDKPILLTDLASSFAKCFMKADLVKNLTKKDLERLAKRGKDTLYFRTNGFTFVVQNGCVLTVEISDKAMRHYNKPAIVRW